MRALLATILLSAAMAAGGDPVVIDGVDRYHYVDPMFESIRIAIGARGDVYPPEYIQGLSGMAFRIGGPCPCAPTCSLAMSPEELCRLLGYEARIQYLGESTKQAEAAVGAAIESVKAQIRAGRAVPVWHAFTNAEWDVVCGFDEQTGEFLGLGSYAGGEQYARAPEGRMVEAAQICGAFGPLLIADKTGALDAREAELSALEEAVRHGYSPRDPFLDHVTDGPLPWRFREGLACYDGWAHSFRSQPDRVPDDGGDRYPLGVYCSTRQAAAPFLRGLADKCPGAEAHLLAAADSFAQDAAAMTGLRDELLGWGARWDEPDPAKAARAAELLATARGAYADGLFALEQALEALDPERPVRAHRRQIVAREGGATLLKGIRPLQWGTGRDCTFLGALHEALRYSSQNYAYSDLMGLSGLAFRTRWTNADTETGWDPSCAVGELPEEIALIGRQIGRRLSDEWSEPAGRDNEALAARLASEIDAGRAVLAYPGNYNVGLVCGYEDAGKTLLVDDYMDQRPEEFDGMDVRKIARLPVDKLGPWIAFLSEPDVAPEPVAALRQALEVAVGNWDRERHDGGIAGREYLYGEAALSAWTKDIESFEGLDEETRARLQSQHAWVYSQLADARRAAVAFLRDWSTLVTGEARSAMREAADLYEQESKALQEGLDGLPKETAEWSAADRGRAAALLARCTGLEGDAIDKLRQALGAM